MNKIRMYFLLKEMSKFLNDLPFDLSGAIGEDGWNGRRAHLEYKIRKEFEKDV